MKKISLTTVNGLEIGEKRAERRDVFTCCQCGNELALSSYYKSMSLIYSGYGHLPICKDCMCREYKRFKIEYMSARKAMYRLCMMFDIYFNDDIWATCDTENADTVVGLYIKKVTLGQYSTKTFDHTIEEGAAFEGEKGRPQDERDTRVASARAVEQWGEGFDFEDYAELDKHYKYLKSANPNCDSNQEIFINDLCFIKMQQLKAVREGRVEDYNKLTESYRKSFLQAGLKTVKDNAMADSFTMGVNVETIEKYAPAEYYKDKKLFRDFDGIQEYIERFMLRPLRNMMHGFSDRDREFCVKEEDDEDDGAEEEA